MHKTFTVYTSTDEISVEKGKVYGNFAMQCPQKGHH